GRGPGKLLMGLHVVGSDGDRPTYVRTLVRSLFVPGALGLTAVSHLLQPSPSDGATPDMFLSLTAQAVPFAFVLLCLATMRARNGYRGVHELASGTRVIRPQRIGTARRHQVPVVTPVAGESVHRAFGPFQ